jgi:tyrosinase
LLWIWENALRKECHYKGAQPWWDWTLDTPERGGMFEDSPVFDPKLGFGGNGKATKNARNEWEAGCVTDGPFAKYRLHMGPGHNASYTDRCLTRDFDANLAENSTSPSVVVQPQLRFPKYEDFSELDFAPTGYDRDRGGPHTTGHNGVGGEVSFF